MAAPQFGDAFLFSAELHLRERGRDGEHHRSHRGCCVNEAASKGQDAQAGAAGRLLTCRDAGVADELGHLETVA